MMESLREDNARARFSDVNVREGMLLTLRRNRAIKGRRSTEGIACRGGPTRRSEEKPTGLNLAVGGGQARRVDLRQFVEGVVRPGELVKLSRFLVDNG